MTDRATCDQLVKSRNNLLRYVRGSLREPKSPGGVQYVKLTAGG
jgi:hypothetical protein